MRNASTRCHLVLLLRGCIRGSRISVDQTRVNDEVWLPRHVAVKIDARVALLKNVDVATDVTFRDYKSLQRRLEDRWSGRD